MNFIKKKIEARLYSGDVKRMVERGKIPDAQVSLKRLKKLGFTPKIIFDIGAYQGDFSKMCFDFWPEAKIYAFEALYDKISPLKKRFESMNLTVVEGIVGQEDQDNVSFYADATASSVLFSEEVDTTKELIHQRMRRLDSFIASENIAAPNFLKIDTLGYEYEVLKGCGETLRSIDVLLLELNFIGVYQNVKLAHEVIEYLCAFDFVMYDIFEIHRRPLDMALFQIDFLFVKKNSFLRNDKRWAVKSS